MLEDIVTVNIRSPYKSVLFRVCENEAAYQAFYNEEDLRKFLDLVVKSGYPMTTQEIIDSSISSDWICFGCSIDWND